MPAMHYIRTRTGLATALVPDPPARPALRVTYWVPTAAWRRAEGAPALSRIDWTGYHCYIARQS